jgi:hypothetical protein
VEAKVDVKEVEKRIVIFKSKKRCGGERDAVYRTCMGYSWIGGIIYSFLHFFLIFLLPKDKLRNHNLPSFS